MGSVHQVSVGVTGHRELAELNYHMRDEHKEVRGGVVGEGQGLSEEDESKINEVLDDKSDGHRGEVAPPDHHVGQKQKQQQQPLGPIVRWERFLPLRSLKILLVENDDSTRLVVTALLRNCSYEVTTASNGVQAWKILEDLTNHVDLVLTEIVMPCLSGIGLLCKIMSHKTCKNIPVIMMSSHDSMGIVFKCLSKGAVDFLVKPIRKNELKNLWQHVWRRCHSSSASGSESGIQTQKSIKSKSVEFGNNMDSNDEDDNGSIGLNIRDDSDNGSGTQSSWTKHAVEVESPQLMSPSDQLADPHDSTCVQVIYPKPETFCNDWEPMTTTREFQEQKELVDDLMGKDLEIGVPTYPATQNETYTSDKISNLAGTSMDKLPESDPKKDKNVVQLESNAFGEPSTQAADLIGGIAISTDPRMVSRVTEAPANCFSKISESKGKAIADSKEIPSLELSLKRLRSTGEGGVTAHDDRNILRHSDLSAFSRYNTSAASTQAPTEHVGSCSPPVDSSSKVVTTESTFNMISNSDAAPLKQGSNSSSNINDMGSTTKNIFSKPAAIKEKSASIPTEKCVHPSSAFHPVQHRTATQLVTQEKLDGVNHQVQVQHHHHHYHHHHHHVHSMQQKQQPPTDHDDLSLKNMEAAPRCGSSNVFSGPMEDNAANYSLNGSNSGSNHGSSGQNGSSTAANVGGINMDSDNGMVAKGGARGGNGSGGVDHNQFAQREAALNKFRQKRKERCFEKKVRYQSRKRLAEQRPRMYGQFVRQKVHEHTSREVDS